MSTNAGDYNKKIAIYSFTETEDEEGFKKQSEEIILEPFAKVKTTKGFTLIANGSDFEKVYTNFTIRYSKKVEDAYYQENRKIFIKYKSQKYIVEYLNNIDEENIELELQAKKVKK